MDLNHYEINMTQIHQKDKETACFIDILKKTYNKLFDEPISNCTLVISHHDTHDRLVSQANYYYGTNDIKRCLFVIYQLLKLYPTKFESVYILFLVLDDIGDKQNSYICYCKYIEKSKKEDEIYHAYTLSKELEYDIDTAHYICRLQTFGNHRHYVEEKIRLYDKIYKGNICNKFFYFKKIFTMFEIMYFDGYIYRIGDFVNELNQYAVKRILNILDQLFVTKAPEIDYLHEFIDYCFEYKEYNLYLTYKKKDSRIETVDDKLRILIAKEVCNDNSQDVKSIMSKIDAIAIDYGDPYLQYQEFCVESHNYIFKSNAPTSELFNDEIYTRITDLHFCLLDLLLTNSKLSSAEYIIDKLINTYQITDVGINKLTEESIDNIVINDIDTYRNKTILYIGMYLQKMQKNDLAILLLTKLYSIYYSNEDLKRLLNDLHKSKGDIDTANLYEKMLDVEKKKKITSKKVLKTREKYDKLLEILNNIHTTEGKEIYIKQSRKLIKKFFNNSYVYRENKTSKTIRPRKYKRLKHYMKKLKSISYRDRSKSERRKIFREFRNFHGLLFCEWHYIIKNLIFAYFDTGNYKKGMNIIIKFLQGHFFNKYMIIQIDYFYNIAYIGIKAGLTNNDLKSIISICKKLTFDYYPLLYYFTNYFENYGYSHDFRSLQRNLKRLTMRNGSNELCDSQTWEKICNGTMTEFTSSIYKSLDYDSKVKLLSAYYPRYIHKISAKMLLSVITDDMGLEESIMLSTIMLNHSLSKKLTNGEVYMEAGFNILFEAQKKYKNNFDKLHIVLYNIGRAYQLFGVLGWAEVYYRKCIFAKGRVKDYALNNLSRLYNLNGKKDLYFDALNMIE